MILFSTAQTFFEQKKKSEEYLESIQKRDLKMKIYKRRRFKSVFDNWLQIAQLSEISFASNADFSHCC